MITLLRRMRRNLIHSNNTRKYILYALGEIALVVIGILLALQINNWNEDRKNRNLERSTLVEIRSSINEEIDLFKKEIQYQKSLGDVSIFLLDHIKSGQAYEPKLDTLWEKTARFYWPVFNRVAFDLLESRGIDLIRNDHLRNEIVQLFNAHQEDLHNSIRIAQKFSDRYIEDLFDRFSNPITADFGNEFSYKQEVLTPINYNELIQDSVFINKLGHSIKVRYRMSQLVGDYIEKAEEVMEIIDAELSQ